MCLCAYIDIKHPYKILILKTFSGTLVICHTKDSAKNLKKTKTISWIKKDKVRLHKNANKAVVITKQSLIKFIHHITVFLKTNGQ